MRLGIISKPDNGNNLHLGQNHFVIFNRKKRCNDIQSVLRQSIASAQQNNTVEQNDITLAL